MILVYLFLSFIVLVNRMEWDISENWFMLPHFFKILIGLMVKSDYMQNGMNGKYFEFSFWGMIVFTSLWEYPSFTQDYLTTNLIIWNIRKIIKIMKWEYISWTIDISILFIQNLDLIIRKKCNIEYPFLRYIYIFRNMSKYLE